MERPECFDLLVEPTDRIERLARGLLHEEVRTLVMFDLLERHPGAAVPANENPPT